MPKGTLPLSETVATLARSASAMHDAMVALAIEDPDDRMASTGMAEATLARVVIESLVTGLWLMLLDDDLTRQRRYVSQVLNDLDDEHRICATVTGNAKANSLRKVYPVRARLVSTETARVL
ncbi:hypothetical protein [Ornithinimicrobium faecis]|uniref:hypothetical protein n=1 Tax=Ornithinimicrobium faecis TaxID=2934158 RepID=UPI002117BDEE|nr:hypothetical protein [Ornithinimicrobium sp. HY1745]